MKFERAKMIIIGWLEQQKARGKQETMLDTRHLNHLPHDPQHIRMYSADHYGRRLKKKSVVLLVGYKPINPDSRTKRVIFCNSHITNGMNI
jgi:hypothetical protein